MTELTELVAEIKSKHPSHTIAGASAVRRLCDIAEAQQKSAQELTRRIEEALGDLLDHKPEDAFDLLSFALAAYRREPTYQRLSGEDIPTGE